MLAYRCDPSNKLSQRQKTKEEFLPRKIKATVTDQGYDPPSVEALTKLSTSRTLRLLRNVDELEREVIDSSSSHKSGGLALWNGQYGLEKELSNDELHRTLSLARMARSNVPNNDMTREFHRACGNLDWSKSYWGWNRYREKCRNRHAWGEYFRSNLDWDWDLADSLRIMYELPRVGSVPEPPRLTYSQRPGANAHQRVAP